MPLPEPRLLLLDEAAHYVADRCGVTVDRARDALARAFREYALRAFRDGVKFEPIEGFEGVKIDWENSLIAGGWRYTINGVRYKIRNVCVFKQHIDAWIDQPSPRAESQDVAPGTEASISEPAGTVYRTGLAGRPSSWNLCEAECRRRFSAGERYPGKIGESASEWAQVLGGWLASNHPDAPPPTKKTLSNKLSALLRELQRQDVAEF